MMKKNSLLKSISDDGEELLGFKGFKLNKKVKFKLSKPKKRKGGY